jgi:hypothetical protein
MMKLHIKKHRLNQLAAAALAAICFFHTGCRRESDSTVKQSEPTPAETAAAATLDLAGYQKRGGGVVIPNPPVVNSQFDEGGNITKRRSSASHLIILCMFSDKLLNLLSNYKGVC